MKIVSTPRERVKEIFQSSGLKQKDIAKKLGITSSGVSKIVTSDDGVSNKLLIKIADAFRVNPLYLLGYDIPINYEYHKRKEPFTPEELTVKRIAFKLKDLKYEEVRRIEKIIDLFLERRINKWTKKNTIK